MWWFVFFVSLAAMSAKTLTNMDSYRVKASRATVMGVTDAGLNPGSASDLELSSQHQVCAFEIEIQKPLPYRAVGTQAVGGEN